MEVTRKMRRGLNIYRNKKKNSDKLYNRRRRSLEKNRENGGRK